MNRSSSCFAGANAAATFWAACLLVILQFTQFAEAVCGGNSIEMTNAATESCACESGFTGADCTTDETVTAGACSTWDDLANNPTTFTVVPGIANAGSLVSDQYVRWTVSIPVGNERQITNIRIGSSCALGTSMNSLATSLSSCNDVLVVDIPLTDLSGCGFALSASDSTHTLYSGDLSFDFTQTSPGFSNFVGEIIVPVEANIETSYTENQELGDALVYSTFDMNAAIKTLNIADDTTTYLSMEYFIAYPYTVKYIGGALTETGTQISEICTGDSGATPCGTTAFPMTTCDVTGDYSSNFCTQTAYVKIDHNSNCVLNGTYTMANVVIGCYDGATDCPLEEDDTTTTIDLQLASKDFCSATDTTDIEDVVTLDRFIFVYPDNRQRDAASFTYADGSGLADALTRPDGNDNRQSLLYGDYIYGRLDFSGADVTNVAVTSTEVSVDNGVSYSSVLVPLDVTTSALVGDTDYVSARTDPVAYEAALNCAGMGYCAADQSLYFRTVLDSTNLAAGVTLPADGASYEVDLRITVQISLETNGAITTRKRSFDLGMIYDMEQSRSKRESITSDTTAINKAMVMTLQDYESATDAQEMNAPTLSILIPEDFAETLDSMTLIEKQQVEDAMFASLQMDETTRLLVIMYRIVMESDWTLSNRRSSRALGNGPPIFEIIFGNGDDAEEQGQVFSAIANINQAIATGDGIEVQVNGQVINFDESKFETKDVVVPVDKVEEFTENKDPKNSNDDDSAAAMISSTTYTTAVSFLIFALSVFMF